MQCVYDFPMLAPSKRCLSCRVVPPSRVVSSRMPHACIVTHISENICTSARMICFRLRQSEGIGAGERCVPYMRSHAFLTLQRCAGVATAAAGADAACRARAPCLSHVNQSYNAAKVDCFIDTQLSVLARAFHAPPFTGAVHRGANERER